jgi:hypothetical protein
MTRATTLAALLGTALLFTSAACVPEEGPMMEPGHDCMECHGGGGGDESGRTWTVAGTWERQGQQVGIVDAAGKSFTLHTNKAGNFWSSEPITYPLRVSVDGTPMPAAVTAGGGSCNRCHGNGGGGD